MIFAREEYITPVGFAREPGDERRRWIGRFFLLLIVLGLGWLMYNRVIHPPDDTRPPPGVEQQLPDPI